MVAFELVGVDSSADVVLAARSRKGGLVAGARVAHTSPVATNVEELVPLLWLGWGSNAGDSAGSGP